LAQVFEDAAALDQLEKFCSSNGPEFYGLPKNNDTIKLMKNSEPVVLPEYIEAGNEKIIVFDPEFSLYWRYAN